MTAPSAAPTQPAFGLRLATGLLGALLAAMVAGLCGRVPALAMADLQGALGLSRDASSWLDTVYSAGELAAMPFAAWFAITFSMRRFHLLLLASAMLLSAVIPLVRDFQLLVALRFLHGMLAGGLIPILMMAALRFLPLPIRLHALALFAMTATLAPNVALWLASFSLDRLGDWRMVYWHVIPLGLLAMAMVGWGIPKMPTALQRLRQANWFGMALAVPGLVLLVVGLDQGVRLDWFNSPLIRIVLPLGLLLIALYLASEWLHPAPFVKLDLLGRRNVAIGFVVLAVMMMVMGMGAGFPATILGAVHGLRLEQTAAIGLVIGLPQLLLGSCVALLLYQRWVDGRHVFAAGLACMGLACFMASGISSDWRVPQFAAATALHVIGQPMAMVGLLFVMVSVVQPSEGPYLAGMVNIVRVCSTVLGGAVTGQLLAMRGRFHGDILLDRVGQMLPQLPAGEPGATASLAAAIGREATVLAAADVYRVFGLLALLAVPLVLCLKRVPAPTLPPAAAPSPAPAAPMPAAALPHPPISAAPGLPAPASP